MSKLTHGLSRTPIYCVWVNMVQRCCNKNQQSYKGYGGRGITICDEWVNSFEQFYSDMGARPEGFSLDRIDNDGLYCKSNCRWATREQQQNNQRVRKDASKHGTYSMYCSHSCRCSDCYAAMIRHKGRIKKEKYHD